MPVSVCTLSALDQLIYPVKDLLESLDVFLNQVALEFEPEIQELARYVISHQGKRLRPLCLFYSYTGKDYDSIVKAAAVFELIHLATLLHDDVIDNGMIRHRAKTVNAEYGADVAILLGDAFFAKALYMASSFPTTYFCQIVSGSTAKLCAGEIGQTLSPERKRFSLVHYYRIIDLKTAALFSAACLAGGYLASLDKDQQDQLATFGKHLGRAYQIYDDLNDIFEKTPFLGKTLGTDFETQKQTLPILLWLEKLSESDRELYINKILKKSITRADLLAEIIDNNVDKDSKECFYNEIHAASLAIKGLPNESRLLILIEFFSQLV